MGGTKSDKFSVSEKCVALICLNAISSFGELASDVPMRVPDLSDGVLNDDSIAELEYWARELGAAFFDLFCVF